METMTMKLYYVRSTVPEFKGFKHVVITWFMRDRAQPLAPYHEAIVGYAELDDSDRVYARDLLDEMFTEDEARKLIVWLNANRPGTHVRAEETTTPIKAREDGALMIGIGAIPVGGLQDCLTPNEAQWDLPFEVQGYYNLRYCEEVAA